MIKLKINKKEIQGRKGQTILEVARENNIYIPTLCVSESVAPYGACRLCLVEITRHKRKKVVAACLFEIENELEVETTTSEIETVRRIVMELLLARCPESEDIRKLARELGVDEVRFQKDENHNHCVLCALCTRVCKEVVELSAISLASRGTERKVAIPFNDDLTACIACGSCAFICPTKAITLEDKEGFRYINWPNSSAKFKLKYCEKCGNYWAPEKQLLYMIKRANLPEDYYEFCYSCR
jgi:NADH dehydrogenase/NADH:ubiquinone oxidoreductase subunit G